MLGYCYVQTVAISPVSLSLGFFMAVLLHIKFFVRHMQSAFSFRLHFVSNAVIGGRADYISTKQILISSFA